jgi:hypothetical protein
METIWKNTGGFVDCIKIDLKEIGVNLMGWLELPQGRDHWGVCNNFPASL